MSFETNLKAELTKVLSEVERLVQIERSTEETHLLFDLTSEEKSVVISKTSRQGRLTREMERLEQQLERKKQELVEVNNELIELRSKQARLKTEGQLVKVGTPGRRLRQSERNELIRLRSREAELRNTARSLQIRL